MGIIDMMRPLTGSVSSRGKRSSLLSSVALLVALDGAPEMLCFDGAPTSSPSAEEEGGEELPPINEGSR